MPRNLWRSLSIACTLLGWGFTPLQEKASPDGWVYLKGIHSMNDLTQAMSLGHD